MKDPFLTDISIQDSIKAGGDLLQFFEENEIEIDFVLSSSLIRAKETAYHMLKPLLEKNKQPIVEVPYVSEKGFGFDNTAYSYQNQLNKFKEKYRGPGNNINLFLDAFDFKHPGRGEANNNAFLNWLLLESPIPEYEKQNINIVLVTHSHFLKKTFNLLEKPANNSVLLSSYVIKKDNINNKWVIGVLPILPGVTYEDICEVDINNINIRC